MNQPISLMAGGFSIDLQLDGSNDRIDGIFKGCDGFDFTQEVIEFREVTNERWGKATKGRSRVIKIPGNVAGGNITLRRGMNLSKSFWLWFSLVQKGNWFEQRKTMFIYFNQENTPRSAFRFTEAWPTRCRIGEMETNASDIEIEEIEIAYEGFERISV
ncbi:Phage tail protein [Hyella patelloides LEGE 07179]|uniref:Phage tail protein n=1 Tax=Hyella patelloides LEGE 07179 TaxID=945734 RepID=A0A563VRZ9_9CYAN|nr:phage tail protein [Hyella patelloides]VEP14162.1 Phage tail protein [Hyella patelloides LEGE 07179]